MKVIFDKEILEAAVDSSMCSVSDKNTIPIVEGIRIRTEKNGKCSITTYDLEKGFRTEIPCKIEEPGNYVINANKLLRIIRLMPDLIITIEVNEKCGVTVTSGRSKFELHAMEGETFPNLPELSGDRGFTIKGSILKKMLSQCQFSICTSPDYRPQLCGAFFRIIGNLIRIVACDGNRMAIREMTCTLGNKNKDGSELDLTFLIPVKTIAQLSRLIDDDEEVAIYLARKHVIFKMPGKTFFSRLIDLSYIDYERVVPKMRTSIVHVRRMDMIASLERAALVTEDRALGQAKSYVKITFADGTMSLESVSINGSVYDEIPVEMTGESQVMGLNCKFLLECLKACDTDTVEAVVNGPLVPIVILPHFESEEDQNGETENEKKNFLYMVSPIRMNN